LIEYSLLLDVPLNYKDRKMKKNPDIKIIDIRTLPEWRETGIVKGSYTIVSFTQKGFDPK